MEHPQKRTHKPKTKPSSAVIFLILQREEIKIYSNNKKGEPLSSEKYDCHSFEPIICYFHSKLSFVCNEVVKVSSLEQKVLSGKLSCCISVGNYFNRLLAENACLDLTNALGLFYMEKEMQPN
jgi:hypothetical protein